MSEQMKEEKPSASPTPGLYFPLSLGGKEGGKLEGGLLQGLPGAQLT